MLSVENLTIRFRICKHISTIVRKAGFSIPEHRITALVGESGSGKSVTALATLGIVFRPPGIVSGHVRFDGQTLYHITENDKDDSPKIPGVTWNDIRGRQIAYISQEPRTALDPLFTIGSHIQEQLKLARIPAGEIADETNRLLRTVHLDPQRIDHSYSYELSGGMCQLATIAMAIAAQPKLLIADEPTTFLDARFQESVLSLLKHLNKEESLTILFITHSLDIVEKLADRVVVMYRGVILEELGVHELFSPESVLHPYTRMLMESVDPGEERAISNFEGCPFAHRCPHYTPRTCQSEDLPPVRRISPDHYFRCARNN